MTKSNTSFWMTSSYSRRRSNPNERIFERNLTFASKFMNGVKSDELKTM